jgi:hypothetical protein
MHHIIEYNIIVPLLFLFSVAALVLYQQDGITANGISRGCRQENSFVWEQE